MNNLKHFIAIVFSLLCLTNLLGKTPMEVGIQAMDAKKYKEAIANFEKTIQTDKSNISGFYNLGNAYFKNKNYGLSIWAYEKVLKLNPKDADAAANIELCYIKLANGTEWKPSISGLQRLIYGFGSNTWSILAIIGSILISISLFNILKRKENPWKRIHFMLIIGEIIIVIGCIVAAKSSAAYQTEENFAVVTTQNAPVYNGNEAKDATLTVPEGSKVLLLHSNDVSSEIELFDGKKVFVSNTDIRKI
jgi:tetratricopeptide (TPR) repeat protein